MSTKFRIALEDIGYLGEGLVRPECVLAASGGRLYVADWRGGVVCLDGHGRQTLIAARDPVPDGGLKPNGIALYPDGSFLIAHLDDRGGGVWRLARDGRLTPFLVEIDGAPLPPTNFIHIDAAGRHWITVSTRHIPRTLARGPAIADGFIVLVDDKGARIVADGIGYTNEAKVDPTGHWLVVNETFGRRVSRYPIRDRNRLGPRQSVADFDAAIYPDGLEFDEEGGLWVTSIYSNRLLRIDDSGNVDTIVDDGDAAYVAQLDRDYLSGALIDRPGETVPTTWLGNVSSIAFGGTDRRTGYLGSLQDSRIATFRSPVAGVKPPHWNYNDGNL